MEALPVIAETSHALGLPYAVTLGIVVIATAILIILILRDHHNQIDHLKEEVSDMQKDTDKEIHAIKEEMSKQATAHSSQLSELYKLVNNVANDVSFIKGKMTRGQK